MTTAAAEWTGNNLFGYKLKIGKDYALIWATPSGYGYGISRAIGKKAHELSYARHAPTLEAAKRRAERMLMSRS